MSSNVSMENNSPGTGEDNNGVKSQPLRIPFTCPKGKNYLK
jgi:hypothetical protein